MRLPSSPPLAVLLPKLSIAQSSPVVDPAMPIPVSASVPEGLPHTSVEVSTAQSALTSAAVPGLIRKYFTNGQADFGRLYLYRERASAQAWSSDAWRAMVAATYGAQPTVAYFDMPRVVDSSGAR